MLDTFLNIKMYINTQVKAECGTLLKKSLANFSAGIKDEFMVRKQTLHFGPGIRSL